MYDFATAPLWISLYLRKISFFLISVDVLLAALLRRRTFQIIQREGSPSHARQASSSVYIVILAETATLKSICMRYCYKTVHWAGCDVLVDWTAPALGNTRRNYPHYWNGTIECGEGRQRMFISCIWSVFVLNQHLLYCCRSLKSFCVFKKQPVRSAHCRSQL